MSELLEELRAQRDLIQQHLNWLDAQIVSAEGSAKQAAPSANQAPVAQSTTAPTPVEVPAVVATANSAPQDLTAPAATTFIIDEEHHLASSKSDIKGAQIGCLLFFVVGTLLFLFFLFGLPYLIN